jgi:hypothetical protein
MRTIFSLPVVVSIPALILIGYAIADVLPRPDLALAKKALWLVLLVLAPVVGVLIYLVARPFDDPGGAPDEGNERTAELLALVIDHEGGKVTDIAFAVAKQRVFGYRPRA